ncbi:hypothetical protein [Kitasatospora sp. NPDC085879]|uniref:hypothetical protein n=1 Tax=Kitasatospora sp. NPDC085879 TaxID=3154769 RepID=UPI003431AB4B
MRIADCLLCAGDPDAALALLSPDLLSPDLDGAAALPALVRHELHGLRDRTALLPARTSRPELPSAIRRPAARGTP